MTDSLKIFTDINEIRKDQPNSVFRFRGFRASPFHSPNLENLTLTDVHGNCILSVTGQEVKEGWVVGTATYHRENSYLSVLEIMNAPCYHDPRSDIRQKWHAINTQAGSKDWQRSTSRPD